METKKVPLGDCKTIGNVQEFKQDNNIFTISCKLEKINIIFYKADMVRILMSTSGEFKDPTEGVILAKTDFETPEVTWSDAGDYYKIQSDKCVMRLYKEPLRFAMYDKRDKTCIWEEKTPLQYSTDFTKQTLSTKEDEYFYGGGVQNGYFSHKNKKIFIEDVISHWNDGSVSNPAPFYMSTAGYGAFRNTFKTGVYEFTKTATMSHNENRFDCFYFYGPSLKQIMNGYTELTGRPTLIPRWGFGLGDADCYNTSNTTYTGTHNKPDKSTTLEALKVVENYRKNDMPGSWILPNDGYGCGYTNLEELVKEAWAKYGFRTGLWTQNGVEKIAEEVGELGSRLCKLDVAWVGSGYEFALNASKTAFEGIENSSIKTDDKGTYSERGYIWSVCGWAGTQRFSTVWSGDQSGNWEYIRFHIPTYICGGLSGMPYIGSDIDGIFGGSAKTQVRDLQWKAFTPIMINMSGWAEKDKQPWVFGEPYTSINRKYLKLKQRLTPYMYSYANEAYETGAPMVRAMVWEYPKDEFAKGKDTQYQFMCGNWFLVAPIYEDSEARDGIYLPQGRWIDYWTGVQYQGGRLINGYKAPLETLPLLVRAGAIIPMYPESLYDGEVFPDDLHPLTLDVYPSGITSFTLYEDDGHTTLHRQGSFAKTLITSEEKEGKAQIIVNAACGKYEGMPFARKYEFVVHTAVDPEKVTFKCGEATAQLERVNTKEQWEEKGCCCWYFATDEKDGILYIKTKAVPLINDFEIALDKFKAEIAVIVPTDLSVPEIPRNLRVVEAQDSSIRLEWDKVDKAEYYEVLADGIVYSHLQDRLVHKNLEFVSTHKYQIRAVNAAGFGEWSGEILGTTLEDKMRDAVPTEELFAYATSSCRESYGPLKAVDGDNNSQWISNYNLEKLPQVITVDMAKIYTIEKLLYVPREQGDKAVITKYNLYVSKDGRNFNKIIDEGTFEDDGQAKTIAFEPISAKSIRLEAIECSTPNYPGASVKEISIFKVPGTKGMVAADYTGDGKVDVADLNFVLQYYRITKEDNDWSYVSKADINKDGVIGIYDIAYVASLITPAARPRYENKATGILKIRSSLVEVKNAEEFTIDIVGESLEDLYAFESVINLDKDKYELVSFESGQLRELTSACKEKKGKIFVAYTNVANAAGIGGNGVLATVKLRAKSDGIVDLALESSTIVGTNLDVVDALSLEPSYVNESAFELKIPQAQMEATATAEETQSEDCSAYNVLDGNVETYWNVPWDKSGILPQSLIIDLGDTFEVSKIVCMPRGTGAYGIITSYTIYAIDSNDKEMKISEGQWVDDGKEKEVKVNPVKASKIKITANEGNNGYASMVEVNVYAILK